MVTALPLLKFLRAWKAIHSPLRNFVRVCKSAAGVPTASPSQHAERLLALRRRPA
jgi:hypothetical protein